MNKRFKYLFLLLAMPGLSTGQGLRLQQFTMEDGLSKPGARYLDCILKRSIGKPYYLLFIFFLFCASLRAQENKILVEKIPVDKKPGESVGVMFQDSTGLIWLRGSARMVVENGKEVEVPGRWFISDGEKVFEVPFPPVPDSSRLMLKRGSHFPAPNECVYLTGDSLRIFDPYTRRIVQAVGFGEGIDEAGKNPSFGFCMVTPDSVTWAVVYNNWTSEIRPTISGKVVMVSRKGGSFKKVAKVSYDFNAKNIAVRGDQLFLTAYDTVRQYNIEGDLVKVYVLPPVNSIPLTASYLLQEGEAVQILHFIKNEKTGGYDRAVYELAPGDSVFTVHPYPELNEMGGINFYKINNHFWLIDEALSLNYFSPNERKVTDYSKYILQQHPEIEYYHNFIGTIIEDRSGTIWTTTLTGDVLKISSPVDPFTSYLSDKRAYNFCNNNICAIRGMAADGKGNLYFAYDYGIQKMDIASGKLSNLKLDLPEKLRDVYSLSFYNQKLYLNALEIDPVTGKGKALIPNSSGQRITHYIDKENGQMWIADGGNLDNKIMPIKLYRYDFKTAALTLLSAAYEPTIPYTFNQVSQFHLSPTTHTLFMATLASGVYELKLDGTVVQHLSGGEAYRVLDRSLALYEDDYQQLWIGHQSGLSKLNLKTKEFTKGPYHAMGAFVGHPVYSIQRQDKTYCWLGTSRGLYRLNVETGELRSFLMFPMQSRREFNRLSTFQDTAGKLYFGSLEGLLVFDPEQVVREARFDERFPVQISLFSRYDTQKEALVHTYDNLSSTSTFHIYPYHQYFSMEVFVADLRDAKKNTYTWWLENYEADWSSPSTSNTIRYDNLPPGEYILHARGGILPENYESSERQFHIIVHQAWYKSWWAWCLYATLFLGVVYLLYRFNLNRQLEKQEAIRLHELDTLKTRLYTNITHEFRTPLTVIMGMIENIRGHENERNLIRRNGKNLLRLINQLLDLSKLDSGTMKMDLVQSDIINYLQYLTESFHSMAHEKKVGLTFYAETPELVMDFDEVKIQHVVYNLLTNALKFTKEGGKVVLHANQTERNGQPFLKLKVQDTGTGIPEEQLAHIFDRFYQADNSSTRKGEGTGIGLSLTKELVELMGGSISVKSELGKGTTFTLLLPVRLEAGTPLPLSEFQTSRSLAPELVPDMPGANPHPANIETTSPVGEKPVLLLIEDNSDVTAYIVGLLEKEYEVHTAPNGLAGIETAFEIIPDIIISDVMMPGKDGYEVCETLKHDERTSHIPIILLTAKAEESDRIAGLRKGADAYLMKPFNKEELFVRLEKLLELRRRLQAKYGDWKPVISDWASQSPITNHQSPITTLEDLFLQKIRQAIEAKMDDTGLGIQDLCRAATLSHTQVFRKLKALTGLNPTLFIRKMRLQKAAELLKTTEKNVSEIAYEVGFSDPNYFSRAFHEEFGRAPSEGRK